MRTAQGLLTSTNPNLTKARYLHAEVLKEDVQRHDSGSESLAEPNKLQTEASVSRFRFILGEKMTLSISAHYIDNAGQEVNIPLKSDIGGTEAARLNFYGSPLVHATDAKYLPALVNTDLVVYRKDFAGFENEIDRVLQIVQQMERAEREYWSFRLDNIKAAIKAAAAYDNSYVWIG